MSRNGRESRENISSVDLATLIMDLYYALASDRNPNVLNAHEIFVQGQKVFPYPQVADDIQVIRNRVLALSHKLESTEREARGEGLPEPNYRFIAAEIIKLANLAGVPGDDELHARHATLEEALPYSPGHARDDLRRIFFALESRPLYDSSAQLINSRREIEELRKKNESLTRERDALLEIQDPEGTWRELTMAGSYVDKDSDSDYQ